MDYVSAVSKEPVGIWQWKEGETVKGLEAHEIDGRLGKDGFAGLEDVLPGARQADGGDQTAV